MVRAVNLWNVIFLAGLLASVRVMVAGVERGGTSGVAEVRVRWAALAGLLTLSGFIGSLLTALGRDVLWQASGAVAGAVVGAGSALLLVRRVAAMEVSDHEFDPRYMMQGVPAVVVEPIPANGDGLVRLPEGSRPLASMRARSIDGAPISAGVEVGVERIDDGVAFVEAWSAIEARL